MMEHRDWNEEVGRKAGFGKEYKHDDHQVKVDLSQFRFRGSLRSAFLVSSEFVCCVFQIICFVNSALIALSSHEPGTGTFLCLTSGDHP